MDFRIIHHHVGARGNVPLPLDHASPIRDDFAVYYYDADETALTDKLRFHIKVRDATLLPYCIGAKREKRAFHIHKDAYSSSLYPFNSKYREFSKATYLGQATMEDSMEVVRTVDVDVVPLDEICGPGTDVPAPDYLSIDAEGAELDIMRGAAASLKNSVVWLRSEMWIHEVYEGAATFEQSMAYLKARGFELFHMEPYGEYEADCITLGMHGLGQTLGAEVDFQHRLDDLLEGVETDLEGTILKLYKFSLLALLNGGNGLAFTALKKASALEGTFFVGDDGTYPTRYLAFLAEVWRYFSRMTKALPVLPDFSSDVIERRQQGYEYQTSNNEKDRKALIQAVNSARKNADKRLRGGLEWANKLMWMESSPLEDLFKKHGLVRQARTIEENRKRHCETYIKRFYELADVQ
jgi:FkbM family methyltransferase